MAHPSKYHQHRRQNAFHKAVPSHCAVNHNLQPYEPNSIHHSTRCVCSHYCLNKPPAGAAWVGPAAPAAFCCCWAAVPSCGCIACLVRRVLHQKPLRMVGLAGESNSTAPDSNKAAPQQRPPSNALLVQPLLPQQASRWCCLGGSCTPRHLLLLLGSCPKLWLHAWCGGRATRSCCTW
jgi:hypothetical protein